MVRVTADQFRKLDDQAKLSLLNGLSEEDAMHILYDWSFWAREAQLEPPGLGKDGKFIWFARSGRGSGKTRQYAEWVLGKIKNFEYRYPILIAATVDDARDIMIEGESGIIECAPPWFKPVYNSQKKHLVFPNGTIARVLYATEPEVARGKQSDMIWADELVKWRYPQETFDNAMLGLRLGRNPVCGVSSTPKPIPIIKDLSNPNGKYGKHTIVTTEATFANKGNLAQNFIDVVIQPLMGTRLGLQELEARVLDDNPNALWHRKKIEEFRVSKAPTDLVRIVVAIDPAATAEATSNETGIIIAGKSRDGHYYVLGDRSGRRMPVEWGAVAVSEWNECEADCIVGETNNGGDMVEMVVQTAALNVLKRNYVPFVKVTATRGKVIRAEPVSLLYEKGLVHHVGFFAELEDQLCDWVPGDESPDRLDALVWALTALMTGPVPGKMTDQTLAKKTRPVTAGYRDRQF